MGSIERRLERLEGKFPPLPEPINPEDLPLEDWVAEEMEGYQWVSLYGIEDDEEQYERWCKGMLEQLYWQLGDRMRESGYRLAGSLDNETARTLADRVVAAFEPHALYWLERFEEAAPQREAKREMHGEWLALREGNRGGGDQR